MSSNSNAVPPDDWRRQGQEKYLKGKPLTHGPWRMLRPDWDHDHCEFCGAKFAAHEGDLKSGYSTVVEDRWICAPCFADFRDEFEWQVAEGP